MYEIMSTERFFIFILKTCIIIQNVGGNFKVFFWLGYRPHLRIKDIFQKEIKGCWKNRKSFPIIPNNAYEHLKLLKSAISATGREFLILPLWHSLNSNKGGDEYEI